MSGRDPSYIVAMAHFVARADDATEENKLFWKRSINYVLIHEKYKMDDKYFDIALIRFDRPLRQRNWNDFKHRNARISPICLPTPGYNDEKEAGSGNIFNKAKTDLSQVTWPGLDMKW